MIVVLFCSVVLSEMIIRFFEFLRLLDSSVLMAMNLSQQLMILMRYVRYVAIRVHHGLRWLVRCGFLQSELGLGLGLGFRPPLTRRVRVPSRCWS